MKGLRALGSFVIVAALVAIAAPGVAGAQSVRRASPVKAKPILPRTIRGKDTLATLDEDQGFASVAAVNRRSPMSLTKLLRSDASAWLGQSGRLLYVDAPPKVKAAPSPPVAGPFPSQTFLLHRTAEGFAARAAASAASAASAACYADLSGWVGDPGDGNLPASASASAAAAGA